MAHPLDRVFGSVVIDKLEADYQRVSSAKYFAALRKMSRSSRSFAFSFSSWRIRSESVVACALSRMVFVRARLPVPFGVGGGGFVSGPGPVDDVGFTGCDQEASGL